MAQEMVSLWMFDRLCGFAATSIRDLIGDLFGDLFGDL
jgi:hypothetical protein